MRFSACYKLVQLSGFFWNQYFITYNSRWCGWNARVGPKKMLRFYTASLMEGGWRGGLHTRSRRVFLRQKAIGLWLLHYTTPFLSVVASQAWQLLRHVRLFSNKGYRLQFGLPTNGQRTHTNASMIRKTKDRASRLVLAEG